MHDTTLKIQNYKFFKRNSECLQYLCLQSQKFSKQNSKYTQRNKKERLIVNSVICAFVFLGILFMLDLSFSLLSVHCEFGSENFRDCKHTSFEH
jgi:Fe2+ transport system protein B